MLDKEFNEYLDLSDSDDITQMSSIRVLLQGASAAPVIVAV